ncbi:MAG: ABC transporter permease [Bacteroidota bacterium]|nr:ABC transporter permease [Bacteroidota bacterium]
MTGQIIIYITGAAMIKNYLKIAFRNLIRHKAFSAINIAGLAIGIASCMLVFIVVSYELSYDKFQPNYKRIYRVVTQDKFSDGMTYNPGVPGAALKALRLEMPGLLFGAINSSYGSQVTVGTSGSASTDKKFIEKEGIYFSEPNFFNVFSYKWLVGNPSVLAEPGAVVLTQKTAEKYFGNWQQAINKTIKFDNAVPLKVTGILQDAPQASDFPLAVLVSFETLKSNSEKYNFYDDWNTLSSNFQVYTLLPENVKAGDINKQLARFSTKHNRPGRPSVRLHFLQPLSELHFDNRFEIFGNHITGMAVLWTLSLIGIFIIIMACINFINLSTAQAVGRSKEVGIRKVLGSSRKQLFFQVMGETGLLVIISTILAMCLAALCLPFIKHIASIEESLSLLNLRILIFVFIVVIVVTILSGLYPSLVLSNYKPALALKNKITSARVGGISLRRGLVVMQFAISQVLIIGTIIAISQMGFINNADLGFNKEAVLVLQQNTDSAVVAKLPAFKERLLQTHGVVSVSFSSDVPSSDNTWASNFAFNHKEDEKYQVTMKFADPDYFKTYGLQFIAGKIYDKSDTIKEVVLNETLVHKLGEKNPQDVIGKDIRLGSSGWNKIVGVVKDFKTNSLKENIKPLLLAERSEYYGVTSIKLRSSNIPQTQARIQSAWNQFFPDYVCTSSFIDEGIANFYEQETHLSLLYKLFACLAIFISCLGLYGLVSFMAAQKTKEIGVRKVLGASVTNIVYLFSKEFTILILVAFAIAAPIAYFMMHTWLNDFVYRINIGMGIFVFALCISIIIAWITVGYKALKAALVNPVKSLRSE